MTSLLFSLPRLANARHLTRAANLTRSISAAATHPYFVPRNSQGSLPVYTDIRNGGTRYLVLVRNVDGNAAALAKDLSSTLFDAASPEAARVKIQVTRDRHLVVSGGHWKNHVMEWLIKKGF
ncbi:hypothetical protein BDN72DRAFT_403763 [Pluteus cervinus]|uniref:Uncharacterized protein n=1 Tax=Pluteus cervinus TaxID=181527 RepID=A0ACD3A8Z0_9AGAR|nr:hypothetical protein BDN72DRAFT_403763 [Pluteus cervinus]